MMRLKSKLLSLNAQKTEKVKIFSPRNCEELLIPFKSDKMAKVVGKLASVQPPSLSTEDAESRIVTGVLVQNDFKLSLMAPEDLREYAGLNTTTVTCKQKFTLGYAGVDLIRWALEGTYGAIEELPEMHKDKASGENGEGENGEGEHEEADEEVQQLVAAYLVMGCITVRYRSNREVEMEWEGNLHNDSIADSVMAVLMMVETSPAAVKRESTLEPLNPETRLICNRLRLSVAAPAPPPYPPRPQPPSKPRPRNPPLPPPPLPRSAVRRRQRLPRRGPQAAPHRGVRQQRN